jgi:hypothetical protein
MGATYEADYSDTIEYERPVNTPCAARCIQVIDLGTHPNTHPQAKYPTKRELMIVWELSELMEDGKPFVVNWRGTMSLGDKANLAKLLLGWRGKAFTEEEKKAFAFGNLLGIVCLLNFSNDEKNGKTWTNVVSLMPLPPAMPAIDQVNPSVDFGVDEIGTNDWEKLYPWVQKIILEKSEEGQAWTAAGNKYEPAPKEGEAATTEPTNNPNAEVVAETECPF